MAFAGPTDVETAYEGSLPAGSEDRVQYLLDMVSARLRLLIPDLTDRIDGDRDLGLIAKDIVVMAVLNRLPGTNSQQIRSQTQAAGPWSTTVSYSTDKSGTFSDEDLALLGGGQTLNTGGTVGTIKTGPLVDWFG